MYPLFKKASSPKKGKRGKLFFVAKSSAPLWGRLPRKVRSRGSSWESLQKYFDISHWAHLSIKMVNHYDKNASSLLRKGLVPIHGHEGWNREQGLDYLAKLQPQFTLLDSLFKYQSFLTGHLPHLKVQLFVNLPTWLQWTRKTVWLELKMRIAWLL